jgi:hypothetical protein
MKRKFSCYVTMGPHSGPCSKIAISVKTKHKNEHYVIEKKNSAHAQKLPSL